MLKFIPSSLYLKCVYSASMDKKLDLKNPMTFNEKIQWLKLYDKNSQYINLVDKYEVRKFVKETIGEEYLIPLVGVFDNFDEINFDDLPNEFVLKCSHDSGSVLICRDKSKFDISKAQKKMKRHLKRNYYWHAREWCYKKVKPRIICEKFMMDESHKELKDYKVFCFNGKPRLIQVDFDRFASHKKNIYTTEWEFVDVSINHPNQPTLQIPKPERLDDMLYFARVLSRDIPFVRVDFYSINNRLYFGEMTFYPGSGYLIFSPESLDLEMGSWIDLPEQRI